MRRPRSCRRRREGAHDTAWVTEARSASGSTVARGLPPTMQPHDAPTAATPVAATFNDSQMSSRMPAYDRPGSRGANTLSQRKERWTLSACGQDQHIGTTTRPSTSSWCRCIARAEPCSGVQAMCFFSGASSMRGGRSTRASRQSRIRTLPPRRADASPIPSVHRALAEPSHGAFRPRVTSGGEDVAAAGRHSGRTTRIRGSTTQYRPARVRRRARSTTYLSLRIVEQQTPRQVVLNPCNRAGFDSEGPARWRAPTAE